MQIQNEGLAEDVKLLRIKINIFGADWAHE